MPSAVGEPAGDGAAVKAPRVVEQAPAWIAGGTPATLREGLIAAVGEQGALMRASDIVRFASDASPYLRFPQAVAQPRTEADLVALLAFGRRAGVPLTFRGGGTSLNGQSQGDGILVDLYLLEELTRPG